MGTRFIFAAMLFLLAVCLGLNSQGAADEPFVIHVDVQRKALTLWQGSECIRRFPVATGAWDTPTPVGVYTIVSRFSGDMCGFGTCFLGLNVPFGQYGIHGTDKPESIGHAASHGCIRLSVPHAEELYALVPNGTQVVIEDSPYGEIGDALRPLRDGDRSSAVMAVQRKLRALGYYRLWPDGVYGPETVRAVALARKDLNLPAADGVDWAFYQAIGLTQFE
ncbi:MAG: L,D-transpeptidase family protein [Clostridia bacterium]|nr:L,D-transpeptidase family protein [Clostridia bacterium]